MVHAGLDGGADRPLPQHHCLLGGDLHGRAAVDPQGRSRGGRRLRHDRLAPLPKDRLPDASYFADKTFNPFVPYPIVAVYFILATLLIISLFSFGNARLNRHLPGARRRLKYRPQVMR